MALPAPGLLRVVTLLQQNFTLASRLRGALQERLEDSITALEHAARTDSVTLDEIRERLKEVRACMVRFGSAAVSKHPFDLPGVDS